MIYKSPVGLILTKAEPTAAELRQAWLMQELATTRLEFQFRREVAAILNKYANSASSAAADFGANFSIDVAIEGITPDLLEAYTKQYRRTINTMGEDFFDGLGKSFSYHHTKDQAGIFAGFLNMFVSDNAAKRVKLVTDTTRNIIKAAIQESIANNLGPEGMANLIKLKAGGIASKLRATTIARTETHQAAQFGQQAASESTGLQFRKYWIAADDERTRIDHSRADADSRNTIVRNNEPFMVGGEALMYPGDSAGSASNTINCRCGVARRPIIPEN